MHKKPYVDELLFYIQGLEPYQKEPVLEHTNPVIAYFWPWIWKIAWHSLILNRKNVLIFVYVLGNLYGILEC